MSQPRRKPDIFWEIVDNPPVTDRWQRHVLLVLAKHQSEQGRAVALRPEELVRTGFSLAKVQNTLASLINDGHLWEVSPGYFWVKRPPRQNRWLWEHQSATKAIRAADQ